MGVRGRLFFKKDPYLRAGTEGLFLRAVRECAARNAAGCPEYAKMLAVRGVSPEDIRTEADLALLPMIPTLYIKRHRLFSVPENKLVVTAASSGTKGNKSLVGFDRASLFVIGRPLASWRQTMMGLDQYRAVTDVLAGHQVPVIMDADVGHIAPAVPLAIGAQVTVSARGNGLTFAYPELAQCGG